MTVQGFTDQGSFVPDNLVGGEFSPIARLVTIASGTSLLRGAVLGKITASGKYKLSASASSDGSQIPDAILAEAVDATSSDKQGIVYFAGEFNELALIFGAGITADNARDTLRDKSIFLTKNQGA
jgi:hypothetical protein